MTKKQLKRGCHKKYSLKGVNREEWLQMRREGIGGSDAAVIMGLNRFSSPLMLWMDKRGEAPEQEETEAMKLGNELEDYVARRWMEETGKKVVRRQYMFGNSHYPHAIANVDREVVGENAALECKTTSSFSKYDWESGEIPPYYYCQCVHYMAVCGYDRMYLAVLVLGKGFHHFVIQRNEAEIEALMNAERDWWDAYILDDQVPEADGSESSAEAVKALFPESREGETKLLYGAEGDFRRLEELDEEIEALQAQKEEAKQRIQMRLGDAEAGSADGWKVTWKSQKSTRVDTKRLKEQYPAVYDRCKKEMSARVFKYRKEA